MNTRNLLLSWVALAGLSAFAEAQDGTFRTWFETPETVLAGESFEVWMWVSFESDLWRPEGYFSSVTASFEITGDLDTFESLSEIQDGIAIILDSGTPDGPWLRDVLALQSSNFPEQPLDYSNPLPVLSFSVQTLAGSSGYLNVNLRAHSGNSAPLLVWNIDDGGQFALTDDPNMDLIATPALVRVIPAPGTVFILAITGLGASRRRR